MTDARTHGCPCGCGTQIRVGLLVCPDGWMRLPAELRTAVVTTQKALYFDPADTIRVAANRTAVAAAKGWWGLHPLRPVEMVTAVAEPSAQQPQSGAVWPRDECDLCHAPIFWGRISDVDRVAVEVEPVTTASGCADVVLEDRGQGLDPKAWRVTNQRQLFGRTKAWRTHLSVCPFAGRVQAAAAAKAMAGRRTR